MPFLIPLLTSRVVRVVPITVGLLLLALAAAAQPSPPEGWLDANIGGGIGTWSSTDEGFTVTGSGTDIWDTADSFHFTYQQLDGDGEFRARVVLVDGAEDWTKAGLMIRASLEPGSPHHFLLASKGKGLAYQRRLTVGGTSLHTALGFPTTAVWYRIVRTGARVALGMSSDGVNWKPVATVNWPTGPTYVGFAVTSHDDSTTATAFGRFQQVALTGNQRSAPLVDVIDPGPGEAVQGTGPYTISWQASSTDGDALDHFDVYLGIERGGAITYEPLTGCTSLPADARSCTWASPGPATDAAHILVVGVDAFTDEGRADSGRFSIEVPQTGTLPPGWSSQDIGDVAAPGSAAGSGEAFTVSGSGADIWNAEDEFHFVHKTMSGDFTVTARVASIDNVNRWTKAGVMIRESLAPGAVHGSLFATPSTVKGTAFQYRLTEGGSSASIAGPAFAPPVWLKLVRRGPTITSYYRHTITDPWTTLHYQVYDSLADALEVGLAVSSHVDGQVATAKFSDVLVEPLPAWQLGGVASNGTASMDQTIFGLFGQGSDIWGVADSFMYGFIPWVGDGTMTARVRSVENSSAWAKAGVMFRESLTPGSKHVFAMVTPGHGANIQFRPTTGGESSSGGSVEATAPAWVRLTRTGDAFSAEVSTNGVTWTSIGSATVQMGQTVYVGIAHTSHDAGEDGGATFDDLRITR